MKLRLRIIMFSLSFIFVFGFFISEKSNAEDEMRGAWVSSIYNIDWPKTGTYNPSAQKAEYIRLIESLKDTGINTVVIQVRPESDALYQSKINPWSRFLTGTQGKYPGYDPLKFVIDESHKRGIKVHAWFNPYRAWMKADKTGSSPNNPMNIHPDWVIKYNNRWYYDPGNPQVTNYIVDTVSEVVRNYDIDGVHFDDYFYPDSNFPDYATYKKYGSGDIENWRRNNINNMLTKVNASIKQIKPSMILGVSPSGIWRNKSSDINGSDTNGSESYSVQHADSRFWIKNNLIDYIAPQVYWTFENKNASYSTLVKWWSDQMTGSNVKLYIGQGIYKQGQDEYYGENVAAQIKDQLILNKKYANISGSIFFSASDIVNNTKVAGDIMSFYSNVRYPYQSELIGINRADTAIKISKLTWPNGADTVVLVNGYEPYVGIVSSPLASLKNAPILLSSKSYLSTDTINEIKRLGAKKIILIGTSSSIDQTQIDKLSNSIAGLQFEKIYGNNIYDISNNVARNISNTKSVDKIYLVGENGMADAVSIGSVASRERNPIIVSNALNLSKMNLDYIANSKANKVYFIGGQVVLSDNIIDSVNRVTGSNMSANRIWGANRLDTNSNVIKKFYPNLFTQKAFLTRSDILIDATTVSVAAQKFDSPVILVGNSVNKMQNDVLYPRSASHIYKAGGQINIYSYNKIYNLLYGSMQ